MKILFIKEYFSLSAIKCKALILKINYVIHFFIFMPITNIVHPFSTVKSLHYQIQYPV